MTADHVIPYRNGGRARTGNIVTACASCNSSRDRAPRGGRYTTGNTTPSSPFEVTARRRMSAAAQDAALAAMWAAADRRRIGWILGYLRKCIVHRDYRNYAGLLPEGSASGYSRSSMPSTSSRGRPRSKIYVKRGARLQSMMLLGRVTCDTSFSRELADSSNIEAPIEHTFI